MAVAAAIVAVAATVGSAVMQANATAKAGDAQSQAFKHDADIKAQNAEIITEQTADDMRRMRVMNAREFGTVQAGFAGAGVSQEGSALDVLRESVSQGELDVQTLKRQGELKIAALSSDAQFDYKKAGLAYDDSRVNPLGIGLIGVGAVAKAYPSLSSGASRANS